MLRSSTEGVQLGSSRTIPILERLRRRPPSGANEKRADGDDREEGQRLARNTRDERRAPFRRDAERDERRDQDAREALARDEAGRREDARVAAFRRQAPARLLHEAARTSAHEDRRHRRERQVDADRER